MGPRSQGPLSSLLDEASPSMYEVYAPRPSGGFLSPTEKQNLLIATGALTLALTVVMSGGIGGLSRLFREDPFVLGFLALVALLSTGTGFAMHEMAHKYVAQRYRCWAEFRYSLQGLMLALVVSMFGFLLAAPGAVFIAGRVDERQNGIISIAGPLTNTVVAIAMLPIVVGGFGLLSLGAYTVAFFNAFLAVFNMIPFGVLDGAKVLRWNAGVYAVAIVGMGALLGYIWFGLSW